ncbi:MAG: serine/threonine protein kinase, partial [Myxococcales bacterium]|nr:serine/threonine protein kinase [Myxococcales bacterium]
MIGRFVIEEPVGAGGMGIVYRARDHELDRDVALKLLRHELPGSEASRREWLYSEARALARLSHPNVVQVYEVGTFKRRVFIAMEYVSGITLDAWRRAQPRSSWRAVYARYLEAGRGLAAAHGVGIVHRDFKPHNALLGDDGRVRVVDFGLAQPVDGDVTSPPTTGETSAPSARGTALAGTPAYMSPEQLKRQPVDARSDQF